MMDKGISRMDEAHRPGVHFSPLLRRIQRAAGEEPTLPCLRQLAVERGCSHYENTFEKPNYLPEEIRKLTNEEIGVALCLAHFGHEPLDIRIAAEIIASNGVSADRVAALAIQERCSAAISYIASAGRCVEPANPFWAELLGALPGRQVAPNPSFPHWTRFVSMTGLSRNGGKHTEWLRPCVSR